jgi:hypothetical protein
MSLDSELWDFYERAPKQRDYATREAFEQAKAQYRAYLLKVFERLGVHASDMPKSWTIPLGERNDWRDR